MIVCRCGHGIQHHRPSPSAISQARARARIAGGRVQARKACWFGAPSGSRKVCKCRDYTPVQEV